MTKGPHALHLSTSDPIDNWLVFSDQMGRLRVVHKNRVHCVALLEDRDHRLLYIEEPGFTYRNKFYFPSGKLEASHERDSRGGVLACLADELLEEAGYRVDFHVGVSLFTLLAKNLTTGDTSLIYVASVSAYPDLSIQPDSLSLRFMSDEEIQMQIRLGAVRDPALVLEFLRILRLSPQERVKTAFPRYIEHYGNGNYDKPKGYTPPEASHDYMRFRVLPPKKHLFARIGRRAAQIVNPLKKLVL